MKRKEGNVRYGKNRTHTLPVSFQKSCNIFAKKLHGVLVNILENSFLPPLLNLLPIFEFMRRKLKI